MRKILPIVIIVIIIAGLVWFGNKYVQEFPLSKYSGPVEEVKMGVSKSAPQLSALIYIAENKGYFTDNKLNVIFTVDPNSTASRKNVTDGIEDLGTTSDFGFVGDSFRPTNLRILAVISNTNLIEIIGRKDKGITKSTDLKGKRIALSTKSSGEFFFGKFLEFNNLKLSDVTVVPTDLDKVQAAIVAGVVDGAVTNDPFAYDIKKALGENALELPSQINRNNNLLLISSKEAIKSKSVAIERFLLSLLQAQEFVKTHQNESKQILAKRFKLDPEFLNQNWLKNNFTVSLNQSLLIEMEDEARFMITNKLTDETQIPNFTDFLYKDALLKMNSEAVTLY